MATSANLSSIIKHYSEKNNSPFIDFREFCVYIKKYAEHKIEDDGDLVKYLDSPGLTVAAELQGLSEKHLVSVITVNNKKIIVYLSYFAKKYAELYRELKNNTSIPYPIVDDLPKQFPTQALERKSANQYIPSIVEKSDESYIDAPQVLYIIEFTKEMPALLLPASTPLKILLESAQQKIRKILKKEEYHDYFLKKLRNTNPTKEISIRNFYSRFVDDQIFKYMEFNYDDDYYLWNQTLYYITKDFEKIQDKTVEDINILQACQILEIHSSYLKEKFQKEQQRDEALKELESNLKNSPFFYSMDQLLKFQDENGRLLYGRYSEEDLTAFLKKETTEGKSSELPSLLIFKVASETRYFVYKKYVPQVVTRLCNEAHISIEKIIEDKWYEHLMDFDRIPEMTNPEDFETLLIRLVKEHSPVLYAILTSTFMQTLAFDKEISPEANLNLFVNGHLLPYKNLLYFDQNAILSNAKLRLPFFYTIPIISGIIGFFHNLKKRLENTMNDKKTEENKKKKDEIEKELEKTKEKTSKQEIFASKAEEIAKSIIPEGSTVDRELDYLIGQWNRMLSKDAYQNLTEDVNSLIRDYTRKILRSLSTSSFTKERIEALADSLVNTPNMKRIPDTKPLKEYVTLYILRLISNI